jgi:hypothetical protein
LRAVEAGGHFGDSPLFTIIPLKIASITRAGGDVKIRFNTLNGSRYVIQASQGANGPWSTISSPTGDGTPIQFTPPPPATGPQFQFYRVGLVSPGPQ